MQVIPPLTGHELLLVVFQFAILLLVARSLGEIMRRVGMPSVVGELLAGFVLGHSLFGNLFPRAFEAVFPQHPQQFHLIEVIMWVGVIMLLVLTGLETDTALIVRKGKGAAAISIGGIVVPFATGFGLGLVLPQEFLAQPGQRFVFALFIGTAMSISAIPVIAKILMEMRVIRRDLGQITLAAGMIDDTAGWILLSLGAGMNARGAIEIIVATIGLSLGVLTLPMYSIILMISIVTSIMAPPLLRWSLRHVEFSDEEQKRLAAEERREDSFVANLKRVLLPSTGGAKSQVAAQVLQLLVEGEDVEVTRMIVTDAEAAGDNQGLERIDERFQDVRQVEREVEDGIASALLAEAGQGYDLLVLAASETGAKGGGPLFKRFVDEIIQDAPCPLLVVATRPEENEGDGELDLRHILLPARGTTDDRRAAEVAFWLARDRDIVVDVIHVVSRQHYETLTGTEEESASEAVEMGKDLINDIAELGHAMGATVHTDVFVADQRDDAIVDYARGRADLVVLASDRRPVSQRAFFGHGTDHILREAPCPVVVVSGS